MTWNYQNRSHEAPWVFKSYWQEPYSEDYSEAESGQIREYTGLAGLLNPLVYEARAFESAKDYAEFKAKALRRQVETTQKDLTNPKVVGVLQFRGKAVKPVVQTYVYEGNWQHAEFKELEKKRGVRIEWVDPKPMIRKKLEKLEADLQEGLDFYADRWRKLTANFPITLQTSGSSKGIQILAYEDVPEALGGQSLVGWVLSGQSDNAGHRCDDAALRAYPEAPKWFVMQSSVLEGRQRQGIGFRMYEALFNEIAKKGTPALVAPQQCWTTGGTSAKAQGLWKNIYARYPHMGEYVILGESGEMSSKMSYENSQIKASAQRVASRYMQRNAGIREVEWVNDRVLDRATIHAIQAFLTDFIAKGRKVNQEFELATKRVQRLCGAELP